MTRYTGCDIEVHLCNVLEGMPLQRLDEDASLAKASAVVEQALMDAYPDRTVHVHMQYHTFGPDTIAGYPNDIEPEDIKAVVDEALGNVEAWYVEAR